jgi:hypothetical protein
MECDVGVQREWTSRERSAVMEVFWRTGRPACPTDDSALEGTLQPGVGGCFVLAVHCPVCGAREQLGPADDPMRGRFRHWTSHERQAAVGAALAGEQVKCPADGASLTVVKSRSSGSAPSAVRLQCPRCGQGA